MALSLNRRGRDTGSSGVGARGQRRLSLVPSQEGEQRNGGGDVSAVRRPKSDDDIQEYIMDTISRLELLAKRLEGYVESDDEPEEVEPKQNRRKGRGQAAP